MRATYALRSTLGGLAAAALTLSLFGPTSWWRAAAVALGVSGPDRWDRLATERLLEQGRLLGGTLLAALEDLPSGATLRVRLDGLDAASPREFSLHKIDQDQIRISLAPEVPRRTADRFPASANGVIPLRIRVLPPGDTRVTVNGRALDPALSVVPAPLGAPIEISAERLGYKTFRRRFLIRPAQAAGLREWPLDIALEPERFGYLTVRTQPNAEQILVNGQSLGRGTPLENEKVAIGTYRFQLINRTLGLEKTVLMTIEEGKGQKIVERLEPGG